LVTDNFFEIGGNSLLAITVMSKIESAFETELGLRLFFDDPKIISLAESIDILKLETKEVAPVDKMDHTNTISGEI
jgi:hypothetical protein